MRCLIVLFFFSLAPTVATVLLQDVIDIFSLAIRDCCTEENLECCSNAFHRNQPISCSKSPLDNNRMVDCINRITHENTSLPTAKERHCCSVFNDTYSDVGNVRYELCESLRMNPWLSQRQRLEVLKLRLVHTHQALRCYHTCLAVSKESEERFDPDEYNACTDVGLPTRIVVHS